MDVEIYIILLFFFLFSFALLLIYKNFQKRITSLKKKHKIRLKTLKEESKKFRIFLKNIPAISCSMDKNGKVLFIEGRVNEITGYSKEDFLKGCIFWEDIIVKEDISKIRMIYNDLIKRPGAKYQYSFRIKTKNNSIKWLNRIAENVTDINGDILYIQGITYDITNLKRGEEKIKELYELNDLILNSVVEGIIGVDLNGNIKFINNAAIKMLQYQGLKVLDKNIHELIHKKNIPKEKCFFIKAIKDGRSKKIRSDVFHNSKGDVLDVDVTITPLKKHGKLAGSVICFNDIRERKTFEMEILRLINVIEQADVSIVITDINANIIYVNEAFEKTTGYSYKEAIGKNPRILNSKQHNQKFYKELWNTISNGDTWRGEFINKKKDGTLFYEDAVIFPILDLDGKIINYASIKKDITREKELEERLKLTQKLEAMGQMVGGVAHDFNNILTIISGYTELMLLKNKKDESFFKPVNEIQNAVERAKSLVSQLLTFSRKQIVEPKPVDVGLTIKNIEKMLRRLIPEDIDIEINIQDNLPMIWADDTQIEQILFNLIINAKDAIISKKQSDKKIIKITISEENVSKKIKTVIGFKTKPGKYIKISVYDTGIGIRKDILNRIFEPFFTTKETGKGTGLGLATVYGIVTQNNGFLNVKSEVNKWTQFEVYFPVYKEKKDISSTPPENIIKHKKYTETILFVEDEETILTIGKEGLTNIGYNVITAKNGITGYELYKKNRDKIDLVITDIVMPELDGFEMYKKLKKLNNEIKIIFTTGYIDSNFEKLKKDKNVDFIMKPYNISEINNKIRKLLKGQ